MPDLLAQAQKALTHPFGPSSDYDLNPDLGLPIDRILRPAAVLVAIEETQAGLSLLLTKRSATLKHHPGQIAFPGGKQDASDPSPEATALREAQEEIGLPASHVEILGKLPNHETVTGFDVTPIVVQVTAPFDVRLEIGEVDEVFSVPLAHVLSSDNFIVEARQWQGGLRSYYAVPYGPYYIWGATARILRAWTDSLSHI